MGSKCPTSFYQKPYTKEPMPPSAMSKIGKFHIFIKIDFYLFPFHKNMLFDIHSNIILNFFNFIFFTSFYIIIIF